MVKNTSTVEGFLAKMIKNASFLTILPKMAILIILAN